MTCCIYTISHPLTNEVVYVGASKKFEVRAKAHLNKSKHESIYNYVKYLRDNFLLPKIEPIEICDECDLPVLEFYWINQLKAWGFNLLNLKKVNTSKVSKYAKVKYLPHTEITDNRKSKRWSEADFILGTRFIVECEKRAIFIISFRQASKKFNSETTYLNLIKKDGHVFVFEVDDRANKTTKPFHITKNGKRSYTPLLTSEQRKPKKVRPYKEPKLTRYKFKKCKIGDTYIVPIKKEKSFQNSFGMVMKEIGNEDFYWTKEFLSDGNIKYTITDKSNMKPFLRVTLEDAMYIRSSKESPNTISEKTGIPVSSVYRHIKNNYYNI
jgi:hypothetical protein